MPRSARRGLLACVTAVVLALACASVASAGPNVIPIAGGGLPTSDPSNALHATLALPQQVAVLRNGNFFDRDYVIADYDNCAIRQVSYPDAFWQSDVGAMSTAVGRSPTSCGNAGNPGTDGTTWKLDHPTSVSATNNEHVLIADSRNGEVDNWGLSNGLVTTIAGGGGSCPPSTPTTSPTAATFCQLWRVAADPNSSRYLILDQGCAANVSPCGSTAVAPRVFLVDTFNQISLAATGCTTGTATCFEQPLGITWVGSNAAPNDFLITDAKNNRVLKYTLGNGTGTTVAGTGAETTGDNGDGGLATAATFVQPSDVVMTGDGGYYIADHYNCAVRKVTDLTASALIFSIAGGCQGNAPDSTVHSSFGANLYPYGLALGPAGLYVASYDTNQVELLDRTTIVSGPSAFSNVKRPTFQVETLEGYGMFVCGLDVAYDAFQKGPDTNCGSVVDQNDNPLPYTVPNDLGDAQHTFYACTTSGSATHCDPTVADNADFDPTPASWIWTLDTTPPTGLSLIAPADGAAGQPASPTFMWTAGSGGLAGIHNYELWIDGKKDKDVPKTACTPDCSATPSAGLAAATHKWHVRAVDEAGNSSETGDRSINVGSPPTAAFTIAPNPVLAGRPVTFDGTPSKDFAGNAVKRYEWDLDGDGTFETDGGASPTTNKTYPAPATVKITLRVTDAAGATATHDDTLTVSTSQIAGQLGVTINNGAQYTNSPNVTLNVVGPANLTNLLVSNDGGFLAAQTFKPAKTVEWKLDSSGPERLPKTVYVRFIQGPITSPNFTDDIILDERPPVVDQASVAPAAAASSTGAIAATLKVWKLKVKAHDSNSGVAGIQATANKKKPGKLLKYKKKLTVKSATRPKFIRAKDRAGNYSRWKKLK